MEKNKFYVAIVLLLIALAPLPYGYYYLLKLLIFLVSISEICTLVNKQKTDKMWVLIALAILYNPLMAVPLGKPIWCVVNIFTVIYFIYLIADKDKNKSMS